MPKPKNPQLRGLSGIRLAIEVQGAYSCNCSDHGHSLTQQTYPVSRTRKMRAKSLAALCCDRKNHRFSRKEIATSAYYPIDGRATINVVDKQHPYKVVIQARSLSSVAFLRQKKIQSQKRST